MKANKNLDRKVKYWPSRHLIERAVATIGKDASSGEGMTFYTVTLEYFKFLLPDEHFMLARTFLQQVYDVEEGAELVNIHSAQKEVDVTELCRQLDLHHDPEQESVARQLVSCLETSSGVILVGPSASGKSAIIGLAHALLGRTTCRKEYLHFSSYTEVDLIGENGKEGILSRLLQRKEEEALLLHIDGHFPESLALPLSLLADSQQFMDGEGRKVVPGLPVNFILETVDLKNVSEAFLARTITVDISTLEPRVADLILNQRLCGEGEAVRKTMLDGIKLLESAIEQQPPAALDKYLQRSRQVKCQEMMDVYDAISTKPSSEKERMNYLVYSFYWAFTSCFSDTARKDAAVKIKECVEENKGSVFSSCTIQVEKSWK